MKKFLGLFSAGVVALALVAPAGAAPKQQKVEGTIALPARHPDGCYTGLQRHWTSLFGEQGNGVVGWTFRVDKATWNKPFKLDPTSSVGPDVDLDIVFYFGEFVSRDEWIANPAPPAPANVKFEDHDEPGEKGTVPKGAVDTVVCVFASEASGTAGAVDFSYLAGKGVK